MFRAGDRDIPCTLVRATVYHDEDRATGFELDARFDDSAHRAAAEAGAFELTDENRGDVLGGELEQGRPVTITLFLRPALLPAWFSAGSALADEAGRLLEGIASSDHPLAGADAWIFLSVMQEVPGHAFQIGFKHRRYQEGVDAHLI